MLVIEANAAARAELVEQLRRLGRAVAPFADPHIAFLFLLGRLENVDGVLVNGDAEPRTSRLLRQLEMSPAPVVVVTHSGLHPQRAVAMAIAGEPERHLLNAVMRRTEDVCLRGGLATR